jgi:hypothetical protein
MGGTAWPGSFMAPDQTTRARCPRRTQPAPRACAPSSMNGKLEPTSDRAQQSLPACLQLELVEAAGTGSYASAGAARSSARTAGRAEDHAH